MLAGLKVVGRYRDRSVGSTKFAHIGKFKNEGLTIKCLGSCQPHQISAGQRCDKKIFIE